MSHNFSLNVNASYTDAIMQKNLVQEHRPDFHLRWRRQQHCCTGWLRACRSRRSSKWRARTATAPVGDAKVYGQVNASYQSSAAADLRTAQSAVLGRLEPYGLVNLAIGADLTKFNIELFVANLFDVRGQASKFVQCGLCTRTYIASTPPQTIGLRIGAKY